MDHTVASIPCSVNADEKNGVVVLLIKDRHFVLTPREAQLIAGLLLSGVGDIATQHAIDAKHGQLDEDNLVYNQHR